MSRPEVESLHGTLREKLEWFMLFRLALVTLLLASAFTVHRENLDPFSNPTYLAVASLVVIAYLASLGYAVWLWRGKNIVRLGYVQLVGDMLLVSCMVLLTEGIDSVFTFLFFLHIFNGAVLLGRRGAIFGAVGAALSFGGVALVQFAHIPALVALFPGVAPRVNALPVFTMLTHLVAFFAVALLSGTLAEQVGRVGSELQQRSLDLRALRALHENIVQSVSSGIVTLDRDDHILFVNPAAERLLGRPNLEVATRPLADVNPDLDALVRRIRGGERERGESRVRISAGSELEVLITVSPLLDANAQAAGSVLVLQDVTELRALQGEIHRNAHLAAIGNLSAAIAHEIRNPLAAISGSIEVIARTSDPDQQPLMAIVSREIDRLNLLVTDFLDYARPRGLDRAEVEIVPLLESTIRIYQQDPGAEHVTVSVINELPAGQIAAVDPNRLHQVVWNLLRNAGEAMRGKGGVTVTLSLADERGAPGFFIAVADQGSGFSEAAMAGIFEPFHTTKSRGTGLGLATSYRIIQEHDGVIRATNAEGGGAVLRIWLPLRPAASQLPGA